MIDAEARIIFANQSYLDFVKKTADLNIGDIGIFLKGNDCYIKELGKDRLISRNKDYDDIWPDEEIKTVGKVIGKVEE